MYFPLEEYEDRWSRAYAEMERHGYAVAVFWQRTGGSYDRAGDVYYLTNYASHSSGQEPSYGGWPVGRSFAAVLMREGNKPELHTAEPTIVVDREEVACGELFGHDGNLALGLAARLKELGIDGQVATNGDTFLPVQLHRDLTAATPAIEWVPEEELLYPLQVHKSPRELDLYRETGRVASDALTALMESLIRGEKESVAAANAASIIMVAGGGFQRVAAHHGPKSELAMWNNPLYGYSTQAPKPGDVVRGWVYGPILQGYWIDPGRTSVCGLRPTSEQRTVIEDCVALLDTLIEAHRPGITGRDLGRLGDEFLHKRGYGSDLGGAIWDLYGHGLSTFWLAPIIPAFATESGTERPGWHADAAFHVGQVCTVEAFLHSPGVATATFEQVFILQENGSEVITTTPMIFW